MLPDELCRRLPSKVSPAVTSTSVAAPTIRTRSTSLPRAIGRDSVTCIAVSRPCRIAVIIPDAAHAKRTRLSEPDRAHRRRDRRDRVLDVLRSLPARRGASRRSCPRRRSRTASFCRTARRPRRARSQAGRSRTGLDTRFPPPAACSDPRRSAAAAPGKTRPSLLDDATGQPRIREIRDPSDWLSLTCVTRRSRDARALLSTLGSGGPRLPSAGMIAPMIQNKGMKIPRMNMTRWPFRSVDDAEGDDQDQIENHAETAERVPHEGLLTSLSPRHWRRAPIGTSSDLDYSSDREESANDPAASVRRASPCRESGFVSDDSGLSEVLVFELPDFDSATGARDVAWRTAGRARSTRTSDWRSSACSWLPTETVTSRRCCAGWRTGSPGARSARFGTGSTTAPTSSSAGFSSDAVHPSEVTPARRDGRTIRVWLV